MEIVDLWAREQKYQTHDVNWFKLPDGSMTCSLLNGKRLTIPCPDTLGNVGKYTMQELFDAAYTKLMTEYEDQRYIWDLNAIKRWGNSEATDNQLRIIQRNCKDFDCTGLTKGQASQIINRLSVNWRRGA